MNEKLYTKASIEKTDSGYLAVASTAVEDRHGEVVSIEGWDLKNFKKNPIMLWAHDHTEPAIGVAKNMKVEGAGKKAKLIFEPIFHDFTEKAAALKGMVEAGIINSFSVGFRPLEMDGNTYTKQELLEVSLVNVPANPEARILTAKSAVTPEAKQKVEEWVDTELEEPEVTVPEDDTTDKDAIISELRKTVTEQGEQIDELVKGLKHLNPRGRKSEVVTTRLAFSKVIARTADKMLEDRLSTHQAKLAKVVKRTAEKLIVDHKQELKTHGKN